MTFGQRGPCLGFLRARYAGGYGATTRESDPHQNVMAFYIGLQFGLSILQIQIG
jgi:hypothetical protein